MPLILEQFAGWMEVLTVSLLVTDKDLIWDLLVGHLVLCPLEIDSHTLLKQNWSTVDGTDYALVKPSSLSECYGSLGHVTIARLRHSVKSNNASYGRNTEKPRALDPQRPRGNYFSPKCIPDPLSNPNLIDSHEESEDMDVREGVTDVIETEKQNRFHPK